MLFPRNLKEKSVYFFSMIISKLINGKKNVREFSFQNILCIREDEIGDLCYSLPVFKSLKQQFPNAKITLLCKPFAVSLVENDPSIDKAISNWSDLAGNYDLIVDLRGSMKSNRYALMHRPKIRLDRGTVRFRNKMKGTHPHEVITNLSVIEPLLNDKSKVSAPELYFGDEELRKAEAFVSSNTIRSFAVIHAGARRELRKWSLKNYAAIAAYLKEKKELDIIFCGDQTDVKDIEAIQQTLSFRTFSMAGDFSLSAFAALVSKASVFIGNESGPLHIASVAGAPSLGLFGPGEPHVFYPKGKRTAFLHHVLECNPCDQIHCVHPDNPCVQRITLEEVKNKIEWLLSKEA